MKFWPKKSSFCRSQPTKLALYGLIAPNTAYSVPYTHHGGTLDTIKSFVSVHLATQQVADLTKIAKLPILGDQNPVFRPLIYLLDGCLQFLWHQVTLKYFQCVWYIMIRQVDALWCLLSIHGVPKNANFKENQSSLEEKFPSWAHNNFAGIGISSSWFMFAGVYLPFVQSSNE